MLSFPSASSASFAAKIEPKASPSGFSWVTSRKRSCARIASATAASSLLTGEIVHQLAHADALLHGSIVFEGQLRGPPEPELAREPRLEDAVGGGQALERGDALALRPEDADEDARLLEVGRRLDAGDGDEADPRVLELRHGLREDLPDGLVHSAHAIGHADTVAGTHVAKQC